VYEAGIGLSDLLTLAAKCSKEWRHMSCVDRQKFTAAVEDFYGYYAAIAEHTRRDSHRVFMAASSR
jgi:hypothetical protein